MFASLACSSALGSLITWSSAAVALAAASRAAPVGSLSLMAWLASWARIEPSSRK
jgi:high-affinity Fe2+/Pb2+ permease